MPTKEIAEPPKTDFECVCVDCGREQTLVPGHGAGGLAPCERCGSARVALVTVIRELFGENWRDAFAPEERKS